MKRTDVAVRGISVPVWVGGRGRPLMLVHGGWGGAKAHWSTVWNELSKRYTVVAPELPGVIDTSTRPLETYVSYAQLLAEIADILELGHFAVCGNSLGASIAWQMAVMAPPQLSHAIMVDGFPPRVVPLPVKVLAHLPWFRAMMRTSLAQGFYSAKTLNMAFDDPRLAPAEVRQTLEDCPQEVVDRMLRLLLSTTVTRSAAPRVPVDFIWGGRDRLRGVDVKVGQALSRRTHNSELVVIPDAGHLPQVEDPAEFVRVLESILKRRTGRSLKKSGETGLPLPGAERLLFDRETRA